MVARQSCQWKASREREREREEEREEEKWEALWIECPFSGHLYFSLRYNPTSFKMSFVQHNHEQGHAHTGLCLSRWHALKGLNRRVSCVDENVNIGVFLTTCLSQISQALHGGNVCWASPIHTSLGDLDKFQGHSGVVKVKVTIVFFSVPFFFSLSRGVQTVKYYCMCWLYHIQFAALWAMVTMVMNRAYYKFFIIIIITFRKMWLLHVFRGDNWRVST